MQVCRYAGMQVCKYVSMQVCKYASMEFCKYLSIKKENMQVNNYELLECDGD